jgi:cytochrome b involved in lipid metabolism
MSKTISAQEVKAHSSPEKGMYIVVDETVYDITNFVDEHPGGAKILKRVAGKDATKQFWKCEYKMQGKGSWVPKEKLTGYNYRP